MAAVNRPHGSAVGVATVRGPAVVAVASVLGTLADPLPPLGAGVVVMTEATAGAAFVSAGEAPSLPPQLAETLISRMVEHATARWFESGRIRRR
jgi:molybdopterin-guanine dinucleotide biosynthesis protein A